MRDIGSRRELFVDHCPIERMTNTRLALHHPTPREVAIRFNKPWERHFVGYCTVIHDGDVYRLYYRGSPGGSLARQVTCYAESRDGTRFTRPKLGLHEVNGRRDNNVILDNAGDMTHNFSPFLDTRPGVPEAKQFKAVGGSSRSGLLAYVSPDGIHWKPLRKKPIITKGAFDSQNLVFWSQAEERYLCYFRIFADGVRTISRTTSPDFVHWDEPQRMTFGDTPMEQLYTNQTGPYFRAPHIYVATPARFMPGRQVISDQQAKAIKVHPNYARDCSDAMLMTSRGGTAYDRTFMEAFIRPGIGPQHWVSRTNYPALGIVPTGPAEMSLYVQRCYAQPAACLQRLSLRTDGFASVHAGYRSGEMLTQPLTFAGTQLEINCSTSAAGSIRVEIQDARGKPVPGYALRDAPEIIGDEIQRVVAWKKTGTDVGPLAGKPVRLRFVMRDADLYSLRFH